MNKKLDEKNILQRMSREQLANLIGGGTFASECVQTIDSICHRPLGSLCQLVQDSTCQSKIALLCQPTQETECKPFQCNYLAGCGCTPSQRDCNECMASI